MNPLALLASSTAPSTIDPQVFVEDLFKINLRTGTGAAGSVTGGPNMTGTSAVLTKSRSATTNWVMADSERTLTSALVTSSTAAAATKTGGISSLNSDGFSFGNNADYNTSGASLVDYLFKGAPKFFEVVTWVGNGALDRTIPHSLGAMPGMAICKATSGTGDWYVRHDSFPGTEYLLLNSSSAAGDAGTALTLFDDANLYVHQNASPFLLNGNGISYVAYLFGNDSSAFGNIICSSYVGNGSSNGPQVDLGWEPQFVMVKNMTAAANWVILDEMRGLSAFANSAKLTPNLTAAETAAVLATANATGFQPKSTIADINTNGNTYVFMAIRRPNKPPTSGSTVFAPLARTGTGAALTLNTGIMTDLIFGRARASAVPTLWWDRLRGSLFSLSNSTTAAQVSTANSVTGFDVNTGVKLGSATPNNAVAQATYALRRAPGFFDSIVFKAEDPGPLRHNLGAVPELTILKSLTATGDWQVATATTGMLMNTTGASIGGGIGVYATDTTIERIGMAVNVNPNVSGVYYECHLFATLPGISKVGSYTGDGGSGTVIDCGFSTGARFVMIKRSDAAGDWYVWDSARGIVAGNDPHVSLNTSVAEVTTDDSVDADATGFVINQVAATNINVNGAAYIFWAIA